MLQRNICFPNLKQSYKYPVQQETHEYFKFSKHVSRW